MNGTVLVNLTAALSPEEAEAQRIKQEEVYNATISFERTIGIIIPSIFALIILIGSLGNLLVMLVLGLNASMRNSTNTLILSLAVSDLLFLTVCVPSTATDYVLSWWPFAEWWCGALNYLQFVSAYASVWTLVAMALDRFLAVVFPVRSLHWRSARNTGAFVGLLWAAILAMCIPILFQYQVLHYSWHGEARSTCAFTMQALHTGTRTQIRAFYFSFNFFGYLLPLGITSILYCVFLRRLWGMSRPGNSSARKSVKEESIRAKKKVTYMVSGVIVTFAVCWLPLNICFALTGGAYPGTVSNSQGFVIVQIFAQVLAYANSTLNPILYAFLSENFRRGFWKILLMACPSSKKFPKGMSEQMAAGGMTPGTRVTWIRLTDSYGNVRFGPPGRLSSKPIRGSQSPSSSARRPNGEAGSFCNTTVPSSKFSGGGLRSQLLSVKSPSMCSRISNGATSGIGGCGESEVLTTAEVADPLATPRPRKWSPMPSPLVQNLRRKSGASLTLSLDKLKRERSYTGALSKELVLPESPREKASPARPKVSLTPKSSVSSAAVSVPLSAQLCEEETEPFERDGLLTALTEEIQV